MIKAHNGYVIITVEEKKSKIILSEEKIQDRKAIVYDAENIKKGTEVFLRPDAQVIKITKKGKDYFVVDETSIVATEEK